MTLSLPAPHRRVEGPAESLDPALRRWAHLVEVEDLFSVLQARNARTLEPVARPWRSALDALAAAVGEHASPPRTLVVALAERIMGHLEAIVAAPRRRLRRTREMLPLHAFRQMDARCRRWYDRQPGTGLVEKAGTRQRLLGVRREQSVDVVENRVVAGVVERLRDRATRYLRHYQGIAHPNLEPLRRLVRAAGAFADHPELGEVSPWRGPLQPTNALLRDVHYRPLWDAWTALRREEDAAHLAWERHASSAATLEAIALVARAAAIGAGVLDAPSIIPGLGPETDPLRLAPADWPVGAVGLAAGEVFELAVARPGLEPSVTDGAVAAAAAEADRLGVPCVARRRGTRTDLLALPAAEGIESGDAPAIREWLRAQAARVEEWLGPIRPPGWSAPHRDPLPAPSGAAAVCAGGPWVLGSVDACGEPLGELALGDRPGVHVRMFDPRLPQVRWRSAAELWEAARRKDRDAAKALLSTAFGADARFIEDRVLVVPDGADPLTLLTLLEAVPHSARQWLIPRSVATVLHLQADGDLPDADEPFAVAVLSLGGPEAELNVIERRFDDARADVVWWRWPPAEPLDWKAEAWLDDLLERALTRAALPAELNGSVRLALRGDATAMRRVLHGQPTTLVLHAGGEWRAVTVHPEDARASADAAAARLRQALAGRFALAAPSARDGHSGRPCALVLVEGWPAGSPVFQAALADTGIVHPERSVRFIAVDDAAARGAAVFVSRWRAGRPTWVDVLPEVSVLSIDPRSRLRQRHTIVKAGRPLEPGAKPLNETVRRFGHVAAGREFDVHLPLEMEGQRRKLVARWSKPDLVLDQDLYFDVVVQWAVGRGGPRIVFAPVDRNAPVSARELDWEVEEASTDAADEAGRAWPELAPAQLWPPFRADDLASAWETLRSLIVLSTGQKARAEGDLRGRLLKAVQHLATTWPCPVQFRLPADDPATTAAVEALAGEVTAVLGWALEVRDAARHPSIKRLNLNHAAAATFRQTVSADVCARLVGLMGPLCPASMVEWLTARLRTERKPAEELLMAAGRLLAGPVEGTASLREALLDRADELEGPGWSWAWASGLLGFEHVAPALTDAQIGHLADALVRRGERLVANKPRSHELTETALALMGLLRVRQARAEFYGPRTPFGLDLSGRVADWRRRLGDAAASHKARLPIEGGREIWEALDELVRGARPRLFRKEDA